MQLRTTKSPTRLSSLHPLYGAIAASVVAVGCAGMFQSTSSTSSSEPESLAGTVTFVNQSSHRVCRLEWQGDPEIGFDVNLGTGDSATFETDGGSGKLLVTECDQPFTLWGDRGGVGEPGQYIPVISSLRWVLYDAGQAPASPSGEIALEVTRRPFSEWIPRNNVVNDPALAQAFLQAAVQHAARQQWPEQFLVAVVQNDDWSIMRNDFTGIITHRVRAGMVVSQWDDGHCRLIESAFTQQHDGSSFAGAYQYGHGAYQWAFPCAAIPTLAGMGGAGSGAPASAAPATAGRCENTCSTAYDNECDDGGPNSLYSVCAFGTDCNDCGPR